MCISVIGGIKRLEPQYLKEAKRMGVKIKIFNTEASALDTKIPGSDAVVIFTGKVSHNAKQAAQKTARLHNIPVFMSHACGVCALRECIGCVKAMEYSKQEGKTN